MQQNERPPFDISKVRTILIAVALVFVVIFFFGKSMFITLQPGEAGVIFRQFSGGLDKDHIQHQGFHVIAPWNEMIVYNVKDQKAEETIDVLDKNGLSINVDVTILFRPLSEKIGFIHEGIGRDYINVKVVPNMRSVVRQIMGNYTAEEIFSTKRSEVEAKITQETGKALAVDFVELKNMLIRSVNLPQKIKQAIENKLKQEQEALAYQFKLEREKSEAERKRIAAEGEATANKIVNSSLTPQLLKMRGIEATLELSKSPNSKTVIIGSGKEGMPLILGNN